MSIANYFRCGFLVIIFLAGELTAQDYQGFQFTRPNRKKKKASFVQYNNLIIIPVRINGSKPFNFILDTGVGNTLITDPSVALALGLPIFRQIEVVGVSNQQTLKAHVSNIETLQLYKNIVAKKQYVVVLDEDILNLSGYAGVPIHGLIGYDLFSKFIIKINYDRQNLTFYNPQRFKYRKKKKFDEIPITIKDRKPVVNALVVFEKDKQPIPVKLVFDTGAGHALLLYEDSSPKIQVPIRNIESHLGATLSGNLVGKLGRVQQMSIGKFKLPGVITSFPDSTSYVSMKGYSPRNGNIGVGLIRRFHTIVDYTNKRLIMKPNHHFKKPFDYNRLGMEIVAKAPNYRTYYIAHMRKNSPAMKAGLKRGDQILAIDDKMIINMNISEVYGKLYDHKKAVDSISIYVRRGQEFLIATVKVSKSL